MIKYHKHLGVESKGKLKLHPVATQHTTSVAQKFHNVEISKGKNTKSGGSGLNTGTKDVMNKVHLNQITEPEKVRLTGVTFEDGFVYVDLTLVPANVKGARIKMTRREGNTKRTVGVEFLK